MALVELKVVMLGKEACGKTSLVERFLNHRFSGEDRYQSTIGAAFGAREVEAGGRRVLLNMWDTAGQERFEAMISLYYRGARAAVICYAVNDEDSWSRLRFWVCELRRAEGSACRIYVAATKLDLVAGSGRARAVDYHDTADYVEEIGAQLFETSSKDDTGIEELFARIASDHVEDGKRDPGLLVTSQQGGLQPVAGARGRRGCCYK